MPRPKRTKVGASNPTPKPAVVRNGNQQQATAPEVVQDAENGRRAIIMAERYPKSTPKEAFSSVPNFQRGPQRPEMERDETSESGHKSLSPEVETGRKRRGRLDEENSVLLFGNLRRRQRQPSILGGGTKAKSTLVHSELRETGPFDLLPTENSILAMSTIRRRPRQPSILGKGVRTRSSSVGLEMYGSTLGNTTSSLVNGPFRKRQRQSDTLGSREKNMLRGSGYESAEDDFDPEDESTPLNFSKSATVPDSESHSSPSTSKSCKRRLSSPNSPISTLPQLQHVNSDIDEGLSTRSSLATRNRRISPELLSDTMAPPQSSSSDVSSYEEVRPNTIARVPAAMFTTHRQPLRIAQSDDPPSSPPSLTHSPNRSTAAATKSTRLTQLPPTLNTAQLQALLPRRRRRQLRDAFDIVSSDEEEIDVTGLGSDEDELAHITLTMNRNSRRSPGPFRRTTKLKSAAKVRCKPTSKGVKLSKRTNYSHLASDKENEDEGDAGVRDEEAEEGDSLGPIPDSPLENSQELEERVGTALKNAKRKFENVDKWELEFEDFTAGSSSPWDAR